ncbi:NAD(P)-dependent oxidoreductase [Gryllotalpicola koreensis]|uniref:NAD(P)-dependent oxidoreductase n=1 Tax=Gryllotalpicola koreensis TaxID=993086 RepID=A0ABP7ZZC2_9MICO
MPESDAISTIGFVGLGNMGTPMVARLVEAGFHVQAFDVSSDARARAASHGAAAADSLAGAAVGADAVILMLPNSDIVESVADASDFTAALAPGAVIVDMSSSEPLRTRALAGRLGAIGHPLVDAPVSGGVKGAVGGSLTVMVGGDDGPVARVEPVLGVFGRSVRAGGIGAGHAVKALNNLLSATHLWITGEAIAAGERFGLDPEVMISIFNGSSGRSGSTENKWPNFVLSGSYASGFGLRLMLKDMRIAVGLAAAAGAPSRLGEAAVELWGEAADGLDPAADHTEIARWIEARDVVSH